MADARGIFLGKNNTRRETETAQFAGALLLPDMLKCNTSEITTASFAVVCGTPQLTINVSSFSSTKCSGTSALLDTPD